MVAAKAHGGGRDLSGEFCQRVAPFVMLGRDRRERADGARKGDAIAGGGNAVGAAELIERPSSSRGARGEWFVRCGAAHRESAAGSTQERDEIARRYPLAQGGEQTRGQGCVGGGELCLRAGRDAEFMSRLAADGAVAAGALDESVALEERELVADRGGGDLEFAGDLVGGGWLAQEEVEDRAPSLTERGSDSRRDWQGVGSGANRAC